MAKKIYLSPSDQTGNLYKVGNTNEAEQCRAIADLCAVALKRCGFEVKSNKTDNMKSRVKESNEWGADAHVPIHTNASNGSVSGFRGFYYKKGCEGEKLVAAIKEAVAPITPGKSDRLSAQPNLYEMRTSNAPCAYLELGFHDNAVEAKYIIDHKEELAEAICKGICKHFGVEYVSPAKKPEPGKLYRVQVGAFRVKANADALVKKLKAEGYHDAYILTE